MLRFYFSRNISMVSASPNQLGSFLEDLSKLKNYSFHSCLFRQASQDNYLHNISSVMFSMPFFLIQWLRKASICASIFFVCWKLYEFIFTSSFTICYLQTIKNCTHCFPFNYHYWVVMNIPPNPTTHFQRIGIIEEAEKMAFSLSSFSLKQEKIARCI